MAANRAEYPIQVMSRTLGVSRSGFYAHQGRPPGARQVADAALTDRIEPILHIIGWAMANDEKPHPVIDAMNGAGHSANLTVSLTVAINDRSLERSITAKHVPIHTPPLPAINGVAGKGSIFAMGREKP